MGPQAPGPFLLHSSLDAHYYLGDNYITYILCIHTCNKLLFLDYSECGIRSERRHSRMVGGVESVHGMWPWQAGLYRLDQTTGKIAK